jgi:protein SEY1
LSRFTLSETEAAPPLEAWIGPRPAGLSRSDEEDLAPIGGVDEDAIDSSLSDETRVLSDAKVADVTSRFRKMADGVYVEAKRGALGGMSTTPLWMWGLLLVLGQNEILAVVRNPFMLVFAALAAAGLYITYQLNLWTPIIRMTAAAWDQGLQVGKERLREFLLSSEAGRRAVAMQEQGQPQEEGISLDSLSTEGKKVESTEKIAKPRKSDVPSVWDEEE